MTNAAARMAMPFLFFIGCYGNVFLKLAQAIELVAGRQRQSHGYLRGVGLILRRDLAPVDPRPTAEVGSDLEHEVCARERPKNPDVARGLLNREFGRCGSQAGEDIDRAGV